MSQPVVRYESALEEKVLGRLRESYELLGYEFVIHPKADQLPAFMAGYQPDAIAKRGEDRIAIEVRGRSPDFETSLAKIAQRFKGQTQWRFTVAFGDEPPSAPDIPTEAIHRIRAHSDQVRRMLADGYASAALVMAFSLLEATVRLTSVNGQSPPLKPGTVVQTLAMEGLISPAQGEDLREFAALRNAIVHGDLTISPPPVAVIGVLSASEAALTSTFAG